MVKCMTVINEFLDDFSHKTQLSYKSALNKYFGIINKNPEKYFIKGKRKYNEDEIIPYEQDVKEFYRAIKQFPANTVHSYLGCIRVFLQNYYVDLPNKTWKEFKTRKKGTRAVVQDIVPTKEQFKKIISHGGILEKALVTTLLSSGMRIGELCQITEEDIDFEFKPVKIELKAEYTKTGNKRTVFISNEAADFLKEWLKEKQAYLNRAVKVLNFKNGYTKNIADDRLFPMDPNTARQKWNRIVNKAGLGFKDKNTSLNRLKIHPHVTRKFYRTYMAKYLGRDFTEYFLGHEEGLDGVYRRLGDDSNKKELGKEYLKGMFHVSIFETPADTSDIREELLEKTAKITKLEDDINLLRATLVGLQNSLDIEKIKNGKK